MGTAASIHQHPPQNRGVAAVTGGSAGLGRAIVRELAARGWDVAVLARGLDGLAGAAHDVELAGRRALAVETDVADHEQVEAAAERTEAELGPIELWVNNAMTGVFGEFLDAVPEDYERVTRVVYLGTVNGTRAALARMRARDRGHIIQIGSALAHRGIPLQAAYCGAKHAITGFTESVLTELLHDGSHVKISQVDMPALNTIQFDWVKSSLPEHPQPVPPVYQPEAGARVVADVAERPRRRTWVGGPTVATVLGSRAASRLLDGYLAKTGFAGQQAPDKGDGPAFPSNLYAPVPGDHGAHGAFDDRAIDDSPQLWALRHRRALGGAAVAAAVAGATAVVATLARRS
ncbi:SDR family oxidoreductase [Gryllotalpicola protaetiae]|uniref:SDR family NAD(P)-dependent oxidoreductase n=1 Tax=Gryllotalpicola protaetiae TaxID=2419771 RepID=A0A387BTH7_9MICO|nr:SDR family oxidoreductase [Gryllotalpicola protaetiae]AYG04370.1 SDR family NAD(P)-dependent oxidoreductase [Gryllotalpicola protaetiae]